MHVTRVELVDVRSYDHTTLSFERGVTVLVGPNAQGKTNFLEAIQRAAVGRSHRVSSDRYLVRADGEVGVIRLLLQTDAGRERSLELEVGSARRTRTRVDGQDTRRSSDAIGVLRTVMFAPEDLAIVRGDPSERRRFLDDMLSMRRPAYHAALSDYERVLKQRNQLLRRARGLAGGARATATETLDVWTDKLIEHGAQVVAARLAGLRAIQPTVDETYRRLADRPEPVTLRYESTLSELVGGGADDPSLAELATLFRASLEACSGDEAQRGVTLVGPHRDDLILTIGGMPARGYSSHGEAWTLALALKLATYRLLTEVGDRPVVLLDDVFAELDETRRNHLAATCSEFDQVIVTAAVEADVPLAGRRIDVRIVDGISRVSPRPSPPRAVEDAS